MKTLNDQLYILSKADPKGSDMLVVRISSSQWTDRNGIYLRKNLRLLRRQCQGDPTFFEDDLALSDAKDFLKRITNFQDSPDGIYALNIMDVSTDPETGYVDDWRYSITPL